MSSNRGSDPSGEDRASLDQRRKALDDAIVTQRKATERAAPKPGNGASIAYAFRLSTDFVAGVLVGAAMGWGIDTLAGTSPWGLIVFLLLGFAAGVLNVMRSAGLVAEPFRDKDGSLRDRDGVTPEDRARQDGD